MSFRVGMNPTLGTISLGEERFGKRFISPLPSFLSQIISTEYCRFVVSKSCCSNQIVLCLWQESYTQYAQTKPPKHIKYCVLFTLRITTVLYGWLIRNLRQNVKPVSVKFLCDIVCCLTALCKSPWIEFLIRAHPVMHTAVCQHCHPPSWTGRIADPHMYAKTRTHTKSTSEWCRPIALQLKRVVHVKSETLQSAWELNAFLAELFQAVRRDCACHYDLWSGKKGETWVARGIIGLLRE